MTHVRGNQLCYCTASLLQIKLWKHKHSSGRSISKAALHFGNLCVYKPSTLRRSLPISATAVPQTHIQKTFRRSASQFFDAYSNSPSTRLTSSCAYCHPKQHYKWEESFQPHDLDLQTEDSMQLITRSSAFHMYMAGFSMTLYKVVLLLCTQGKWGCSNYNSKMMVYNKWQI